MFYAVIGTPIQHSRSPLMQNTALRAAGLQADYRAVEIAPEQLARDIRKLVADGCAGFNITIPHKETIMSLLDSITDEAKLIGAVNTVVVKEKKLYGYNTDLDGFRTTLAPHKESLRGKNALLLGAGGAARTAVYSLIKDFAPAHLTIAARSPDKAHQLAKDFSERTPIAVCSFDDGKLQSKIEQAALVVNTTPLGMHPNVDASPLPANSPIHRGQIVFDLIYTPLQTTLLRSASAHGATTLNGLEMLVQQGARAFELFTGKQMPVDEVRDAVLQSLQSNDK